VVTVNFKLSSLGSVQVDIAHPTTFERILDQCALRTGSTVGSVIATRDGKVLGLQEIVEKADVIDVYPAISGG
jgi:sulfur carrier protein ThiS